MSSTSERTFGNHLQHARTLQVAISQIGGYAPDNPDLAPAAFASYLDTVEGANNDVAGAGQALSDARLARRLAYFGDPGLGTPGLGTLAGRVRDNVGSMPGGKKSSSYARIQRLVQKINNYRPPQKPVSASPGETPTEKKKISQSEASYGSLVQHGRDLAAAVAQVPGYAPANPDLQPAGLTSAMATLSAANDTVAARLMEADEAGDARRQMYENPETGLRSRFQQVKAAVASQFGRRSPEYRMVAGIRY